MTDQATPDHGELRALWNDLAEQDALWAVLAFDDKKDQRWDLREFMKVGEREIALAVHRCAELGIPVRPGSALDFGCGVGRLTQALARRFESVTGADISDEMIRLASAVNRYGNRARYVRLGDEGLRRFGDGEFDFVYSAMVLQHIPPAFTVAHLRDFVRILKPGGVAAFQLTSHRVENWIGETKPMREDAYRARLAFRTPLPPNTPAAVPLRIFVTVANASEIPWVQKDIGSLRVGNHWLDSSGELMVAQDDGRSVMPQVVAPGDSFDVDLVVTPPSAPGQYVLEIDVVHEAVSWFAGKGSSTLRQVLTVSKTDVAAKTAPPVVEFPVPEYQMAAPPENRAAAAPTAREFPMYGVPKEVVIATVSDAGGDVIDIEDDPRAGHDWMAYRYFVRTK